MININEVVIRSIHTLDQLMDKTVLGELYLESKSTDILQLSTERTFA
jgi:hypothetical protein